MWIIGVSNLIWIPETKLNKTSPNTWHKDHFFRILPRTDVKSVSKHFKHIEPPQEGHKVKAAFGQIIIQTISNDLLFGAFIIVKFLVSLLDPSLPIATHTVSFNYYFYYQTSEQLQLPIRQSTVSCQSLIFPPGTSYL